MLRISITLGGLLALAACASPPREYLLRDGRLVREAPPAPFLIAIAPLSWEDSAKPVDTEPTGEDAGGATDAAPAYRFQFDEAALQASIVAQLKRMRTASGLVQVSDSAPEPDTAVDQEPDAETRRAAQLDAAFDAGAELLVVINGQRPTLEHEGLGSDWWKSGLLWITTWAGGLWWEDSSYFGRMDFTIEVIDVARGRTIDTVQVPDDRFELNFWDRNTFVSWGTIQSLVLPPFWTTDSGLTDHALTEKICQHIGAKVASFLKEDLAAVERESLGEFRLTDPDNGDRVPAQFQLRAVLRGQLPITDLRIWVDGALWEQRSEEQLPAIDVQAQERGSFYEVDLSRLAQPLPPLALPEPGLHTVRIRFTVGEESYFRTLTYERR